MGILFEALSSLFIFLGSSIYVFGTVFLIVNAVTKEEIFSLHLIWVVIPIIFAVLLILGLIFNFLGLKKF
ncbi:MAG: hypothetical protein WDK96_00390 [Candidatus Paceibacterota bacterium]|jgi:hypothetical protein